MNKHSSGTNFRTLAGAQEQTNFIVAHYLAGVISLSRAAELLQLSWLNLRTRLLRLGIPKRTAARETGEGSFAIFRG